MNQNPFFDRRLLAALLTAGVCTAGFLTVRAQSPGKPKTSPSQLQTSKSTEGVLIETFTVQEASLQRENSLSGQIEPAHIATISAEVAERLIERPIEQGSLIAPGNLLAQMDPANARAALDRAEANLAQATAARRQTESEYARAIIETDAARQQARAQVMQATAGRQQAQAQTSLALAAQKKTRSYTRQQELRQAEAALSQARTDERLAKIEYDRYVWLVKEGASPQQTLDQKQATLDAAIARRQSAEQGVSLAKEGARQEDIEAATAQVQVAQAQVSNTSAQIEGANATLRIANTRDTRLATIREQIAGLRAQEAQAAAAVRQARITLNKHTITAPFSGRVLATLAERGEMVAAGTPIARIGQIAQVKVTFTVPEASRPLLRLGQTVTVTVDALPGQTFTGSISTLGYQAAASSRAFPVEVLVNNPGERLLPNMVARLNLPVGKIDSRLLVPVTSIATDGKKAYVYTVQENRAARREVKPGAPEGDKVEILERLQAGERIAAAPQRLTNGETVRVAAN